MWISKKEMNELSENVRKYLDGECVDIRDNKEGLLSVLKNDIYSLVTIKNEEMAQLEKERDILSEYMADISHQLKTPITSMMIMADLLEDVDDCKKEEFIRNIRFSLSKMEWLVSSLLKMAKLDAKAVNFSMKSVSVTDLVQESIAPLKILLDVKQQNITVDNDLEIKCDKKWTVEAFTNIIKNAIEHSPEKSEIKIDSGDNPVYQWISVHDAGEGMKKEQYAALFKRFEYSTSENGYGIGMPLALSIMKSQNGDIDIDFGGNGKGATFILKFFK